MTADQARKWLISTSLFITGVQLIFLLIAPVIGFPLDYPKNISLIQIVTPVFVGYLGSAVHFIFMTPPPEVKVNVGYLELLVKGPVIIYLCAVSASFFAFGYSNRVGAPLGSGMSIDNLSNAVSIALSILAATTGVIVSFLFVTTQRATRGGPDTHSADSRQTTNPENS